MAAGFAYAVLRAPRLALPEAAAVIRGAQPWLALAGGPGIGWASNEFPVILAGGLEGVDPLADLAGRPGWSAAPTGRYYATVRPTGVDPPGLTGGVVALRHFEVAAGDSDEFLGLSRDAWPAFERLCEARIVGLFRRAGPDSETAGFLLATWYASLAEWERSRGVAAAEEGDAADAGRRFRRRREITLRTVVRIGRPI